MSSITNIKMYGGNPTEQEKRKENAATLFSGNENS